MYGTGKITMYLTWVIVFGLGDLDLLLYRGLGTVSAIGSHINI